MKVTFRLYTTPRRARWEGKSATTRGEMFVCSQRSGTAFECIEDDGGHDLDADHERSFVDIVVGRVESSVDAALGVRHAEPEEEAGNYFLELREVLGAGDGLGGEDVLFAGDACDGGQSGRGKGLGIGGDRVLDRKSTRLNSSH